MKKKNNKLKKIIKDNNSIFYVSIVLFLIFSLIMKLISNNISGILIYILFPIVFLALTLLHIKGKHINWDFPIILTIIYLIIGYIVMPKVITPLSIIMSYAFSMGCLLITKFIYKSKKKKFQIESKEETYDESKIFVSNAIPFIIAVILNLYFSICTFGVAHLPSNLLTIIIGLIITYSFYMILLAIFRNTSRANIILAIILLVIFIINEGRIYYTSDTLLLTDVIFLQNAGEVAGFADVTFINCLSFMLLPTILTLIVYFHLFRLAIRNNLKIDSLKSIFVKTCIAIVTLLVLVMPTGVVDKFMVQNVYNIHDGEDLAITASNTRYFYRYGVISGLYGKLVEQRRFTPNDYDEDKLKELLKNADGIEGTWNQPNIIVVFSESFWDVSKLKDIKFDKDVTPNFHKLQQVGKSIEMLSPAYGGMSSNVEFEILTGGSLNYFSKGYTPYMQLFRKGISDNNPNIIKELKNNGYKTKILNSSSKNMFNCSTVYDIYKVDEVNHLFDEIDLGGQYVTDQYLTDQMIKYFNDKSADEKIFYFMITMGGHMPYFEGRYDNYDVNIVDSPYDKDTNEVIHSYAEGIYLADKELGRIYDYINTLNEDTIVIFFGDHLPHLSTPDGKDALFTTKFLNDDYNLESVYNQFNTTALIVSNYDISFDDTKYLSPDLLLTYVINNMDLNISSYYKWLYSTKEVLPSSNFVVSQDKNGNKYYTLDLPIEMKNMYNTREKMQFMLFK
jgi:hypothetical protein